MGEFVVWDNKRKEWISQNLIYEYIGECGFDSEFIDVFQDIGKTDINDKKIYADSSIVEFEFAYGSKWILLKAYFQYNIDELRCEAHLVDSPDKNIWSVLSYDMFKFKDLKIIDTVQENRLGLMEKRNDNDTKTKTR